MWTICIFGGCVVWIFYDASAYMMHPLCHSVCMWTIRIFGGCVVQMFYDASTLSFIVLCGLSAYLEVVLCGYFMMHPLCCSLCYGNHPHIWRLCCVQMLYDASTLSFIVLCRLSAYWVVVLCGHFQLTFIILL